MPRPMTKEQKDILLTFRRAHGVSAQPHSRQNYHKAYYGKEEVKDLFKNHPFIRGNLTDRESPAVLGMLAEIYLNPRLTLKEMMDCTTEKALRSKEDAGEFLKEQFLDPEKPASIRLFNTMLMVSGTRILNLLKEEVAAGHLDTREKVDAFTRDYGVLLAGLFDCYNQGLNNRTWSKVAVDEKKATAFFAAFGGLGVYCEHRYENHFLDALRGEADPAQQMSSLLAYFAGHPAYRQDCTDMLNRCFGTGGKKEYATEQEAIDELEPLESFGFAFFGQPVEEYGILAKLDPIDQMLLMTDPKLQNAFRIETGEDHAFRKATYGGMDLKFKTPLKEITQKEVDAVRAHMYSHMSPELAFSLYPTLDKSRRRHIEERYAHISREEYASLDAGARRKVREFRKAQGLIPDMTADRAAELPGLRAEEKEYASLQRDLSEKKSILRGPDTREYREMMEALGNLQQEVRRLAPQEAGLTGEDRMKLDDLRAKAIEKTAKYIAEKKDIDQIGSRAGIHRAEAARKLLDALNRGQRNAYRQVAGELEPQIRAKKAAISAEAKAADPMEREPLKLQRRKEYGEELLNGPMGTYFLKNRATISEYMEDAGMVTFFREAVEAVKSVQGLEEKLGMEIGGIQDRCQGAFRATDLAEGTISTMVQVIELKAGKSAEDADRYQEILGRGCNADDSMAAKFELLNARIGKAMAGNGTVPVIKDLFANFAGDAGYFARRNKPEERLTAYADTLTQLYRRLPAGKTDDTSLGVGKLIYDMVKMGPFTREELKSAMPEFDRIYNYGALAQARRMVWGVAGGVATVEHYATRRLEKLEPEQARLLAEGSAAAALLEMGEKAYGRIADIDAFLEASGKLTVGNRVREMTGEKAVRLFTDAKKLNEIGQEAIKDAVRVLKAEAKEAEAAGGEVRVQPAANENQGHVPGI